jgi:glycerate dehydrogenase
MPDHPVSIVVLDGFTLNPGDLSWAPLEALGRCAIYDRTPPEEVVARAGHAGIVLTNKTVLGGDAIARLDDLRYIGVLATGYNIVDVEACRRRNVVVTNVPDYGSRSVAQMAMAHVLNLTQHVAHHAATVAEGRWTRSPDFCYWDYPLVELAGLTMGLVGFGRIGRAVAELARALGMRVVVSDPALRAEDAQGVEVLTLDDLFATADVVSLHCPLTPETRQVVDRRRLALMKPTALLVNTSRGPLVDEAALAEALDAGRIAGAGLDVLVAEPPVADNPLLSAKNCYVTPHVAWATRAARQRLLTTVVDNVRAFLAGRPSNVVS